MNLTPFAFQADVMNGVDPAPQDVTLQDGLFSGHRVKVFLYNQQVTDSLTASFLADARQLRDPGRRGLRDDAHPGYDYQSWMLAEVDALQRAVADQRFHPEAELTTGVLLRAPGGAQRRGRQRPPRRPHGAR